MFSAPALIMSYVSHVNRVYISHQLLATSVDLNTIYYNIALLMRGLKMIWIMSSYYNTDERMTALMDRIVWQLYERVAHIVDIHTLFK